MSDTRITTIKMKDLPESSVLQDSDIVLKDNSTITQKFKLSTLIQYIKNHTEISKYFVHQSTVNEASGVAPLDLDKKIPTTNIRYGKTTGTIYQGSEGAAVETTVNTHVADTDIHLTPIERTKWNDKYTKNEIDNKFSTLEMATDWKESVTTYSDIATTYQNPQDGWTVNTKDTDCTYRYNGSKWVVISANAIPKATQTVDGLLTKEDKKNYDTTYANKHTHSNKTTIDKLSEISGVLMFDGNQIQGGGADEYVHPKPTRTNTTSSELIGYGGKFTVLDISSSNSEGHITSVNTKTITLPAAQTSVSGSAGSCTGNSATATKATNDANGNEIINQKTSSNEPTNQKVGDYWVKEY